MQSTTFTSRCTTSSSSRAVALRSRKMLIQQQRQQQLCSTPVAPRQQQQQQSRQQQRARDIIVPRASTDEEAEIDRMAKQAAGADIWGNEVVGTLVKVGTAAGVVAVVLLIASLAKPMFDNTIASFPTPAEYEQYEAREEGGGLGF